MSPRSELLQAFVNEWRKIRNGRYSFVKRGLIVWAEHDFAKWPFAVSVMCDEIGLIDGNGVRPADISIELFAKMPERNEIAEINDELQDELIEDFESVLFAVLRREPRLLHNVNFNDVRIVEAHDCDMRVQGGVSTFAVDI